MGQAGEIKSSQTDSKSYEDLLGLTPSASSRTSKTMSIWQLLMHTSHRQENISGSSLINTERKSSFQGRSRFKTRMYIFIGSLIAPSENW
jgi:hypothetical protein